MSKRKRYQRIDIEFLTNFKKCCILLAELEYLIFIKKQLMRQKFSKKLKDFLQIYAKSLKNTCISLMVALVLSFSFVGFLKDENPSFLMANVANLNNNEAINAHFPANIVLESSESDFVLRLGENLQKVDFIEGIIAFDPTK